MVISTFSDRLLCQLAQIKAAQPPWRSPRSASITEQTKGIAFNWTPPRHSSSRRSCRCLFHARLSWKTWTLRLAEVLLWWSFKGPTKVTLTHNLFVWNAIDLQKTARLALCLAPPAKNAGFFCFLLISTRVEAPQTGLETQIILRIK